MYRLGAINEGSVISWRMSRFLSHWVWGILAVILFAAAAQAQTRSIIVDDGIPARIQLNPGTTITVETNRPFVDVVIGNTDMVDVFPLTDSSLYIQSKGTGSTNVALYDEERRLIEVIDITIRSDFSELESTIQAAVPGAQVSVTNVNNRIRLSGQVRDNNELSTILAIASSFSSDPVINSIRVAAAQQVELDVRILEVSRNSGRNLGVSLNGVSASGSPAFGTGSVAADATSGAPFGTFVGDLLSIGGVEIDFIINALEGRGLARRLANPKLVTTSGIEANFVVGGEVPIATTNVGSDGTVASETGYREYGVKLNFLPVVLDDSLISLRVTPEVSDVDFSNLVNGAPSFFTRRAETTVTLRDGQSFAIAGLLQSDNSRNVEQVPWLGQVPILGTLFRSAGFQRRETDLVILVTPRLVRPVAPNEQLVSPLDGTRSSNDVELFMYGMLEVDRPLIRRFREGDGVVGPYGHFIELDFDDAIINKN
jgi:pilus assembly protein CpaC